MDRNGERLDIWVDPVLVSQVRETAARTGLSVTEVTRMALRLFSAALLDKLGGADDDTDRSCVVCGKPRRVSDPDPLADTLAHAQCDQITAKLEESANA